MDALTNALDRAEARRRLPPPAERLALREQAGVSQTDVARAIGTTPSTVSRWETGQRFPRGARLLAYLAVLDRLAAVERR